jgi:hypothetical protein
MSQAPTSHIDFTPGELTPIAEMPEKMASEIRSATKNGHGEGLASSVLDRSDTSLLQAAADVIHDALGGKGPRHNFNIHCPVLGHEDRHQSCSVTVKDGKLLVFCHVCNGSEPVIAALKEQGLWFPSRKESRRQSAATYYVYEDESGAVNRRVKRTADKQFPQSRPDPDRPGEWINNALGVKLIPYRLPEFMAADNGELRFVAEGEKDVDNLLRIGIVATCNVGGAGKWKPEHSHYLRGLDVVILADNDDAGKQHAQDVARDLQGKARSVRILNLPGLREHGDVSEWLDDGGTVEELRRLALECPAVSTTAAPKNHVFEVVALRDLMSREFPESREIVPGVFPEGLMTLTARPKSGKTMMAHQIELAVACGGYAFSHIKVDQGDVLGIHLEDGEELMQERLKTQIGDGPIPDHLDFVFHAPLLKEGLIDYVKAWILSKDNPRLIVIDTVQRVRSAPRAGLTQYADDYATLAGLADLAHEYRLCILCLMHSRKMSADDVHDEMSGTLGLFGAADGSAVLKRVRGENDATLHITGRRIRDDLSLALRFHPESATWEILGPAAEHVKTQERQAIIDLLTDGPPEGLSPKEIAEALDKPQGAIKTMLFRMKNSGQLVSSSGKYMVAEASV